MLNNANKTLNFKSFLLFGQRNGKSNFDVFNKIEFLCILSVSSKYMVTIKEKAIFHFNYKIHILMVVFPKALNI